MVQTGTHFHLKSGPTSVDVPGAQVRVGYVLQLLRLALVELLDVAMLVADHVLQDLDLCLQEDHLLLTWHRGLNRGRRDLRVAGCRSKR